MAHNSNGVSLGGDDLDVTQVCSQSLQSAVAHSQYGQRNQSPESHVACNPHIFV